MSTHSMKEYYQSDRPPPAQYRHSQSDLTEWDETNQPGREPQRRSGPPERDAHYPYRNGSREKEEWDENERVRREPRYIHQIHTENNIFSPQNILQF